LAYTRFLTLVPEGWLVALLLALLATVAYHLGNVWLAGGWAVLSALAGWWFSDRERHVPLCPLGVLSPVDGWLESFEKTEDPYLQRPAYKLVIRVNFFSGGYVLHAPIEGELLDLPEHLRTRDLSRLRTDEGDEVIVKVTEGFLLGAPPVWAHFGARIGQGWSCGLRRLAWRFELYIPTYARIEVRVGQKVKGGETKVATFLRKDWSLQTSRHLSGDTHG
jgi:phosphatidylserine decarboxylase